ncbi:MAG TPA: ACP S-malonyltransferase [Gaiellales bacterium]|jgi:[acyl-carrier-protein] S-malonyltransferase|nr:ACP S-malonyltransferase [Gaiellales bacterium]
MSKVAFCFPGQGSQRVGMGRDFVAQFPEAAAVFDEASEELDFDLRKVCFEGPIEQLSQTEVTQPALVASSLAAFRAIQARLGVKPDVVVGHSVGEYAAIAAADSVGVGVVTRLVRERGLAMAASKARGAMAAILGLEDAEVERLCRETGDVWPANYNCPGQLVISGREHGVDGVGEKARDLGAKVVRLRVSGAFHSPLVEDAAHRLEPALRSANFGELRTRFMSTVSSKLETVDRVPGLLVEQMTAPVRFTQSVQGLVSDGVRTFVEVGPGGVLSGLVKRIDRSVTAVSVGSPDDLKAAEASLAGS